MTMIPLIAIGLGGLVWYAHRARGEAALDPGMSPALRREVLALSKRDLTAEELQSLADEFGRAHYHRAQEFFATRLRRSREAVRVPAAEQRGMAEIASQLAGETDPSVLRRVAAVLRSLGQRAAAAGVEARASELEATAPPAELDELLKTASGVNTTQALNDELAALEAELGDLDGEHDDDDDLDETGEEPRQDGVIDAGGEQAAIEAAMEAAERAAKPSVGPATVSASIDPRAGESEHSTSDGISGSEPNGQESAVAPESETEGTTVAEPAVASPRKKRGGKGHRGANAELGGQHGSR